MNQLLTQVRPKATIGATAGLLAAGLALAVGPAAAASPVHVSDDKTLIVKGGAESEKLALRLSASDPKVLEIDFGDDGSADFSATRKDFRRIRVKAGAGDDLVRVDDSNGAFTDRAPTTIKGEEGNDTLLGGAGAERFLGGDGDDAVDGGGGDDAARLGAGDDRFTWDPGEGSDVVEGRAGYDTMLFNGSNGDEKFQASAEGKRLRFTRDVGKIVMDVDGVERVDTAALGGADSLTVDDLTGTALQELDGDLEGTAGGSAGDGAVDRTILDGTAAADQVSALGTAADVAVVGLPALVRVQHAEATDKLTIDGRSGDDLLSASSLSAGAPALTLAGQAGTDVVLGGNGDDHLRGGDGFDDIAGNKGDDVAFMGAGPDRFTWLPGDGDDVVEGEAGHDSMFFAGSNDAERFDVSANGRRVSFLRDVGNIVMDLNSVEEIDTIALGGADTMNVGDLRRTGVDEVNVSLAPAFGSPDGDGEADRVALIGTGGDDDLTVTGRNGSVNVTGLAARVGITHAEGAKDTLAIDTLAGDDSVDSSGLAPGTIGLVVD